MNAAVITDEAWSWDVLLVDADERWSAATRAGLAARACSVRCCRDIRSAKALTGARPPDLIALELRLADGPSLGFVEWVRASYRDSVRMVVVTSYGSVATAVRCARLGIEGYLVKPVTPDDIIASARGLLVHRPGIESRANSLDRARWEYLNQVFAFAGSIGQAAQLLGIDRRSLRRMLSKYAPGRSLK
jgi:two-component system response regulator RegA